MSTISTQSSMTLKGSSRILTKYLSYAFQTILYQRGIKPSTDFYCVQEYGMSLWVSKNQNTANFLRDVLDQVHEWISRKEVDRISLVFEDRYTGDVEEFWEFRVQREPKNDPYCSAGSKKLQQIQADIANVMRQITGTVSFLPRIENVSMSVSVHFVKPMADADLPPNWRRSKAPYIHNAESVPLRSFSTGVHLMGTSVNYKSKHDCSCSQFCSNGYEF